MLEGLNGWVGDRVRVGINGAFEVPRENNSGRRVVSLCAERGLCVSTTSSARVF